MKLAKLDMLTIMPMDLTSFVLDVLGFLQGGWTLCWTACVEKTQGRA